MVGFLLIALGMHVASRPFWRGGVALHVNLAVLSTIGPRSVGCMSLVRRTAVRGYCSVEA